MSARAAQVAQARETARRRRTQLFVPANKPAFVAKAAASGADAVILDLEDSVPAELRPAAREGLAGAVAELVAIDPQLHVLVRVNNDATVGDDVRAAVGAGVHAVLLPMTESADDVRRVEALLDEAERSVGALLGRTELQLLVETPRGLMDIAAIAGAGERVVAMMLGIEDLSTELEIDPRSPDFDVRWAHGLLICAARAHGLAPYGLMGSLANFRDLPALAVDARQARAFGYLGALCIHPVQIEIVTEAFSPTAAEIADARAVVAALEHGEREGTSAVKIEGRMIDTPMGERARRLLA
ncbi:MAG: CoA ester lyase, partial [Aeromicrobium sp.]